MSSALVGFLELLVFFGLIGGGFAYVYRKFGAGVRERRREREIETAMRLGVLDGEIQQRVARKIINERINH